ncbi:hypothetical protein IG193_07885 [Infirmifilum lucidum]|uniref:Uncharacterized protein n=1 Tax=Infirmifilum lucidum TaxID=2776706 RepID=A0A7L9FIQ4_9CREN|nr:hypothetical protein [Infirmifilum lucidum]QOJ78665.1 hypothetical protein IG193_07885 [Infirmifilum lucidum]
MLDFDEKISLTAFAAAGIPKYVAVVGFMVFDNLRSFVSLALYLVVGVFVFRVISGSLQSYALALSLLLTGYQPPSAQRWGVLLLGVGVNLIGVKKIKVGDGLPALIFASIIPLFLPY